MGVGKQVKINYKVHDVLVNIRLLNDLRAKTEGLSATVAKLSGPNATVLRLEVMV